MMGPGGGVGAGGVQLQSARAKRTEAQRKTSWIAPHVKVPEQFLTHIVFASTQPKVVPYTHCPCDVCCTSATPQGLSAAAKATRQAKATSAAEQQRDDNICS